MSFAALLSLFAASFLSWNLAVPLQGTPAGAEGGSDPLGRVLGSAKEVVGDVLFLKADEYFHGGTREDYTGESIKDLAKEGFIRAEHEETEPPPIDWVDGVNRQIWAHRHRHLTQEERKEMLPFFRWATSLDPHNVEALLTTAYWFETEYRMPAEAAGLLQKGVRDNPESWELEYQLARLLVRMKDDGQAETHWCAAIDKSYNAPMDKFQRVSLYYEMGECLARLGRAEKAREAYAQAALYFDEKTTEHLQTVIREKIGGSSA